MHAITLIHSDSAKIENVDCDFIFTDPPYDMDGSTLSNIVDKCSARHMVLITTMKQLIEFLKVTDWQLSFDFVLDAVVPKKSKSKYQPNYTHATGVYLTKPGEKSKFNRELRERSDTFDNSGYWPTILHAPRNRMQDHGKAKNLESIKDILGSFEVEHVYDPFAGSGTTDRKSVV